MDDVALYRGALSAANVDTLYTATSLDASTISGVTPLLIHNFVTNRNQAPVLGTVPDDYDSKPGTIPYRGGVSGGVRQITDPTRGEVLDVPVDTNYQDYATYGDVLDPMSDSYTAAFWFKVTNTGDNQILVSKGMNQSSVHEAWAVTIKDGKIMVRACYGEGDAGKRLGVAKSGVSYDEWHHVALVIDQDSGLFQGYLDGLGSGGTGTANGWFLELCTSPTFTPGIEFDTDQELALGFSLADRYWMDGQLDDLAIWDRALSDEEILDIYGGASIPEPSSLILLVFGLSCLMIFRRK